MPFEWPLKLFEFLEQFVIDTFSMKLTQFEKTETKGKIFISLENLKVQTIVWN